MKYWTYILDEMDTFSVVNMIEHTGSAFLPQMDGMEVGDVIFLATLEYGARFIYRLTISRLDAWQSDDGEMFCDTYAEQPMEISDALLLSRHFAKGEVSAGDEYPQLGDARLSSKVNDIFEELAQASMGEISDEDYQLKRKIIYDAFANDY